MARMRHSHGVRQTRACFRNEDSFKQYDRWEWSYPQLQLWQHQLQHYPRAQQENCYLNQQQQEHSVCYDKKFVEWGATSFTKVFTVSKKEMRPAMDNLWYTVDDFTSFYGTCKGLKKWSWTYYYRDGRTVEVERVDSDGVPVRLLKDEVSDEEWLKWLNAVPTKSPVEILDLDDTWIQNAAAVEAYKRFDGHMQFEDEKENEITTFTFNEDVNPAALLEKRSFDDEELVLLTLTGNLAHRIIRMGVEHPHLLESSRVSIRKRLVSWLFSSGTLTGTEDRAGRPCWAGGSYVFLSRSHLQSINWTNPEVVDNLLGGEKLQSKHILCSGSMISIFDKALNEDVDPRLIVNGRERFQMTRASHVKRARIMNLRDGGAVLRR